MNIRDSVNMVRFCKPAWNNEDEPLLLMVLITYNW